MDDRALEALTCALSAGDPPDRERALRELADSADGRAVDPLLAVIVDAGEEIEFRNRAGWAVTQLGILAVDPLLSVLQGAADVGDRLAALRLLVQMECSQVVEPLQQILADEKTLESLRRRAAWGLGRLAGPESVETLLDVLPSASLKLRVDTLRAIGRLKAPRGVDALLSAASDPDDEVRSAAVVGLGKSGDPRAAAVLVETLLDPNPVIRSFAATALGLVSDEPATEALVGALADPEDKVRRAAAWALGNLGAHGAAPALRIAAADKSHKVREAAQRALTRVESTEKP